MAVHSDSQSNVHVAIVVEMLQTHTRLECASVTPGPRFPVPTLRTYGFPKLRNTAAGSCLGMCGNLRHSSGKHCRVNMKISGWPSVVEINYAGAQQTYRVSDARRDDGNFIEIHCVVVIKPLGNRPQSGLLKRSNVRPDRSLHTHAHSGLLHASSLRCHAREDTFPPRKSRHDCS